MGFSRHVFDATAENFPRLVLENSNRGLVLVNFWTPKAAPCMLLMPRLVKLATEYGGKFLLVMLNTDELGALARRYGVTSVPTVKFFHRGEIVETIHGAEPDSRFRESLDRFIMRDSLSLYARGLAAWQKMHLDEARQILAAAAVEDPGNPSIPRDLAKLLWSTGEHAQALEFLESLPASLRSNTELAHLYAHFALAHAAETATAGLENLALDRNNAEARFQLAAKRLSEDSLEEALEMLLALDSDTGDFRNGLPRQALLALFDMLGPDHSLTRAFRSRLSQNIKG